MSLSPDKRQLREHLILFLENYKKTTNISMDQLLINSTVGLAALAGTVGKNQPSADMKCNLRDELVGMYIEVFDKAAGLKE